MELLPVNQPDRTPPQAEHRAVEILEGVRMAFAEKGFDGASMQDLARACGMSVGNFYRYFPSKAAIVAALVTRDLAEVGHEFSQIIESDDPMATLRAALAFRIREDSCANDGLLWAEMMAAALRKPEIADLTRQMEAEVSRYLTIVFAQVRGIDAEEARHRFAAHASLIVMMIKASAMHRPENPQAQSELHALLTRTLNRVLDEIETDDLKG
ncbi:TetR/AcrR family transcriptional regulator [Paragemmobacter ruber]|uniref:TetR/AcrR family transcriptional regulator n=1 Tax=Paragemmobacter ruber TaxID=1985673 RepID=UPI001F2203E1|nr:TetR/AcrR family transcriptional regulator [Rhodobacter ruber]